MTVTGIQVKMVIDKLILNKSKNDITGGAIMSKEEYAEEVIKQAEQYLNAKETQKNNVWQYTVDKMTSIADDYSMDQVELLDEVAKMFLEKVRELRNTN